jgi:putative ABC transport system permease protein
LGIPPYEGLTGVTPVVPVSAGERPGGRAGAAFKRFRRAAVVQLETLRLALDALRTHKLRSFLTLIGVILAVTTLVAVMSVVAGLNGYVAERIANLGANVYVVDRFGIITSQDAWEKAQKRPVITMEEYEGLRGTMKTANHVAAIEGNASDVRSGNELLEDVNIRGVTPNYSDVRNIGVSAGRFLGEADELHRAPVCFIGTDVQKKFFANVDPIGKTLRAGTHSYEVVGVSETIGSVLGNSQDNFLLIPLGTFRKEWHTPQQSLTLFVQAQAAELIDASEDESRMLLRARRHLPWKADDNFGIIGSASITGLWKELTSNLFNLALGLTSVFLVVGAIVIMNIMLASVTERTREIGIRRSLGARKQHILMQFLAESCLMALAGGLLGVLFAVAVVALGRAATGIPMRTPLNAILLAVGMSTAVGLVFGIYPAMRAARLDPIEALRAEG